MSIRKKLEAMMDGTPPGSLIMLSVDWLSRELAMDVRQDPEELLTLEGVARRVGRAVSTVRTWCNTGKLPRCLQTERQGPGRSRTITDGMEGGPAEPQAKDCPGPPKRRYRLLAACAEG